jgi:tripartite-type tricarboxylate transporter receptor subunit TctC
MKILHAALMSAALCLTTGSAWTQEYPNKPIRVIVGSSPGGISDVFIRSLGDELHKRLGQPLIIENRSGGSFNIAARACTEAANDGYTICILPNEPVTYNLFLFKNLPFDPNRIAPVSQLFIMSQVFAVSSALGVKSLPELAALSKARPKTLSYSSPAAAQALFVEKFKEQTGADLVRVPFKGGGDAVTGLLSGTTPAVFIGIANVISHIRAGTVTPLVMDDKERSALAPDVPTLTEIGYRGDLTRSYFGLFAPAGTPAAALDRLHNEITAIAAQPEFRDKTFVQRGLVPVLSRPGEFAEFLKEDRAASERVVRASGLQPE